MKKKWLLPGLAGLMAVVAALVILLLPGSGQKHSVYSQRDSSGNIVINASGLSSDQITFMRLAADSKIELLARIGDDGGVKVALGTCQSCNGSPDAYYTQEGDLLRCNNCGLTFPLGVLDAPGGGCHPIMIDTAIIQETQDGLILNTEGLLRYEYLFEKVAAH